MTVALMNAYLEMAQATLLPHPKDSASLHRPPLDRTGNRRPGLVRSHTQTWSLPQVLGPVAPPLPTDGNGTALLPVLRSLQTRKAWGLALRPPQPDSYLLRAAHPHLLGPLSPGTRAGPADPNQPRPLAPAPLPHGLKPTGHHPGQRNPDLGVLAAQCQESPELASEREGALGLPFTDSHPTHPAEVLN